MPRKKKTQREFFARGPPQIINGPSLIIIIVGKPDYLTARQHLCMYGFIIHVIDKQHHRLVKNFHVQASRYPVCMFHQVHSSPNIVRGRHSLFSMAKWKFGPCLFNTLRMVFQGSPLFYHLLIPRKVRHKIKVPCTLHLTFLGVRNWPKKVWPWMNCLSGSNEGQQNFQFATEKFKRPPLISIFPVANCTFW